MKVRKVVALTLACTMLVGQTVWAQDVATETQVQVQENQEVSEVEIGEVTSESENAVNTEKRIAEKSEESGTEDSVEPINKTICVNAPIMVDANWRVADGSKYTFVSDNEAICTVEGHTYSQITQVYNPSTDEYEAQECNYIYLIVNGVNKGEATILVKEDDAVIRKYVVTVNEMSEDAIEVKDIALRTQLLPYDQNKDGCLSKEEMESITYLYLKTFYGYGTIYNNYMYSDNSIKSLSGLEYAKNLSTIYLEGNCELSDISVLFGLQNLQTVGLKGTAVSAEDRWKLADFEDINLEKADKVTLPLLGNLFEDGLTVEVTEGQDLVEIKQDKESSSVYSLLAKAIGKAKLKMSYDDFSVDIMLTIDGIPAEQDVGEEYDVEISSIFQNVPRGQHSETSLILDSNHQLWQTYPTGKMLRNNVKEYVAGWVYFETEFENNDDAERYLYLLDTDEVLWNGSKKIAEDVVRFDGRYALNKEGTLINIYNNGSEQIEQVEDWISPQDPYEGTRVYLLKKDGTLWTRQEVATDQPLREWTMIGSNVKQMLGHADSVYNRLTGDWEYIYYLTYLKNDGTLYDFDGIRSTVNTAWYGEEVKVGKMYSSNTFLDVEGNFCHKAYRGTANMGKLDVVDYCYTWAAIYALTKNHKVYKYDFETGITSLLLEGIVRMKDDSWLLASDGTYYDYQGNKMTEIIMEQISGQQGDIIPYDLILYADGSQIVEKNGIPILNHVTHIWRTRYETQCFALRTDGTVWNITDTPQKVLDLSRSGITKGDADGDNEVGLKDLMLCLNHVSKKSVLVGTSFESADIDGNGIVDLKDLMRILNYVSKKSTVL